MSVFKPIRIFLSSRCNTILNIAGNEISMLDVRRSIKDALEAELILTNRAFDVYTNESNYSGQGNGVQNSYEECFKALKASNLIVILYTGEAGWVPVDSNMGICHQEFEHSSRFFSSLTLNINLKKYRIGDPQRFDQIFDEQISRVNSTTPDASSPEQLKERIMEIINDFIKEKVHESIASYKSQVATTPVDRPSIDWSHFTYSERVDEITKALNESLSDQSIQMNKQYNKVWAIPDNMSVADARNLIGRPFNHEIKDFQAVSKKEAGVVHIIGVYGSATETQVKNMLGFPDVAVNKGKFGFYLWEKTSHIQMVFLVKCINRNAISHQLTLFYQWLESTNERVALLDRAKRRFKILKTMHENKL
jgi:hypothetical protein